MSKLVCECSLIMSIGAMSLLLKTSTLHEKVTLWLEFRRRKNSQVRFYVLLTLVFQHHIKLISSSIVWGLELAEANVTIWANT